MEAGEQQASATQRTCLRHCRARYQKNPTTPQSHLHSFWEVLARECACARARKCESTSERVTLEERERERERMCVFFAFHSWCVWWFHSSHETCPSRCPVTCFWHQAAGIFFVYVCVQYVWRQCWMWWGHKSSMYMYVYIHICKYIHLYIYVCVYIYMYICVCVYVPPFANVLAATPWIYGRTCINSLWQIHQEIP